ncbi:hypothetical protein DFS33DRAFT_458970 [Desarmillaria ectypa]|nr:hypothetical protein DFS33DRAFT_458970 [Desarmillaria ectypa]
MTIFQDSNGAPLKFFIQSDLPKEIQAELCENIAILGGRVETKIPRDGFILVSPGSSEEDRLRLCWTNPERLGRFFVPYTFVEACKMVGRLLKQIFVENGTPMAMHIHSSIANINARTTLSERIAHSGGNPNAAVHSARVILADPNTETFQHLIKAYQDTPGVYVESYLWVKKCIERGAVAFTPVVFKNPGGRRPGEERMSFTDKDEELLAHWIAAKIPFKEIGGRTGNRLYQQLCELHSDPDYTWVTRHTWQSWRERYKKNASRFDDMISAIVAETKPTLGEKGQYGYVRQPERRKRSRKGVPKDEEFDEELHTDRPLSGKMETVPDSQPIAGPSNIAFPHLGPAIDAQGEPGIMSAVRGGPTEEELGETEGDWAVRVGDAPPPSWAKRRASTDLHDEQHSKKQRQDELLPADQGSIPHQTVVEIANMHVIDSSIRDIAKEYRFTIEEVQEYYDKCGEMGQTRLRFQKMREMLTNNFPGDISPSQ